MAVAGKRNRWLVSTVLIVAIGAFVGISILPLIGDVISRDQTGYQSNATSSESESASSQQNELETRAQGYELVLQREPSNQTALRGLLDTRIQLGDIEGAIAPLEKLAALNPNQTEYVVLLAQGKQQIGDLEGAAQAYREVLATQPGDMNALQGLVSLLIDQNRLQAAVGLLQDTLKTAEQANELSPGSIDTTSVKLLLGQVYAEDGNSDKALSIYDEAIAGNSNDFRPILAKAIILQDQGQDTEAQTLFATAAALAPDQYKDQISQIAAGEDTPGEDTPGEDTPGEDVTENEATSNPASPLGETDGATDSQAGEQESTAPQSSPGNSESEAESDVP